MKINRNIFLKELFLLFCGIYFSGYAQENVQYQRIYLSGTDSENTVDWEFNVTEGRNSGQWSTIPVPSNWELHGFGTYNYGHDHQNKERKLGKEHGLYRHRFQVPANWKGKVINIVFDGSMTDTKVSINGKSAGPIHQGAFYRFKYDITRLLEYGKENLLEVDVAKHSANESVNRAERQADFWIFGGIFRPVFLEILPSQYFSRIAIDAREDGSLFAHLFINNHKPNTVARLELYSLDGEKIGEKVEKTFERKAIQLTLEGKFNDISSWNPETPTIYLARLSLLQNNNLIYQKEERIGFRTVKLRRNDGIYVNRERVIFKGVNRHSFWPETGRALSAQNHLQDITLMKEMNMNAVRMSHYPPDEKFLDLCDSLGLFVLDEVTGWQDSYDTIVGPKLIRETILKDENHPSVIIWDHGNEGGWDFANEKWFHTYDFQKRPIIYPWLQRNGVDTRHYPTYNYGINRLERGQDPFFPTELLHGLYDGGHGAGLEDFWNSYSASPVFTGGFLWVFSDEAVMRTDKNNVLDADGNHGPDGILGPYREKEGSFYTIKRIWSPVQVMPVTISKNFNGILQLKNDYIYTNLNQCSFSWKLTAANGFSEGNSIGSGDFMGPDANPGETKTVNLDLPANFSEADILSLTAKDFNGKEIYTWSWPVKQPDELAEKIIINFESVATAEISVSEEGNSIKASVNGINFSFNKNNGYLEETRNSKGVISFNGGPMVVGFESSPKGASWKRDSEGNLVILVEYEGYPAQVQWKVLKSGLLSLEIPPLHINKKDIDFIGVSFNYPEEQVEGVRWMGNGPYRVWKNRLKGAEFGIWQKDYNNTVTGESFDSLIYPEFKGYHAEVYWMELQTTESPVKIISATPGLFVRLYTPPTPEAVAGGVAPPFPEGDISFLHEIPAIGTKFKQAVELGPSSQKGEIGSHRGDQGYPIKLWFDFRNQEME
ncbi:glycoside hydrolase family 2 TIM barrel-domain containing protein [soil metagenome]